MGLVNSKKEIQCLVDLNSLPDELLVLILSWVPGRTLVTHCRLVCRRWKDLIDRSNLWKLKLKRDPAKWYILETSLKLAGRLPKIEWGRLDALELFGRNLIKNPCGKERLRNWEVHKVKRGWNVEWNMDFVEGAEAQICFVSSFKCCTKWQVVDLLKEGLWEDLLDNYQPDIVISDCWGARRDSGCSYAISVSLLEANNMAIAEFNLQPDPIRRWNNGKYRYVSHTFQNYGPGVRYVYFLHKGQGKQFWGLDSGARITNSTVLVNI